MTCPVRVLSVTHFAAGSAMPYHSQVRPGSQARLGATRGCMIPDDAKLRQRGVSYPVIPQRRAAKLDDCVLFVQDPGSSSLLWHF